MRTKTNAKHPKSELARLRAVRNITQAIEFLGLSVADFAALMPSQWSTRKHISAQLVCDWKRGRRRPSGSHTDSGMHQQLDHIARIMAEKISQRYGREVGVKIEAHSPWKVTAWIWCDKCRTRHEWKWYGQRCNRKEKS
jgi:hypothetical protein